MIRLIEARQRGDVVPPVTPEERNNKATNSASEKDRSGKSQPTTGTTTTTTIHNNNSEVLQEIRGMKVKELREELAKRNLRWAGLLEKEDLVQAVYKARLAAAEFSVTGKLSPGDVADLTGEEVEEEMSKDTPMLLDVYATWCGPCQMLAPQLKLAAVEWGDKIRVVKMDSDKHHKVASKLHVQGLPTLILFRGRKEIGRMEGALMKDQLIQWIARELQ